MKQYVVDAFTNEVFKGNPAAICIMDEWISDELMMHITVENQLSETAFAVKDGDAYKLRWFTPGGEIDLCGHATLAAAYVIMRFYEKETTQINFQTLSGQLKVVKKGELYEMDFPAYELTKVAVTQKIVDAIGDTPMEAYMGRDLLCVFHDAESIYKMQPNQSLVEKLDGLLLQVTAPGDDYDCISRTFAPKLAVKEDPVCGSGHCHIVPYWANRLDKQDIIAFQASERSGMLYCRMNGDRVVLAGKAALFSVGKLVMEGVANNEVAE